MCLPISLPHAKLGMRYLRALHFQEHFFYRPPLVHIYMFMNQTVFQVIIFTVRVSQALNNLGRGQLQLNTSKERLADWDIAHCCTQSFGTNAAISKYFYQRG